ncbi:hypothetical protein M0534_07160 [Methylonatrum kenyense]|uniref:hypothetical protein n=1 Tax=Methylonatrum kenyense TaxID=455253 RepID=UPI0020BFFEEB|nr:hypothetical protein [Methylonatrum kenyense]MCK8516102.1 hypothetical protein [Methylonatrum kenyense]
MSRRQTDVPTLTRIACPGEELRDHGLWLPLRDAPGESADGQARNPDWSRAMPYELHHRSAALRDRVQARIDQALKTFFETRKNPRPRRY